MKKLYQYSIIIISIVLVFSCSGDDDGRAPVSQNQPPTIPNLVFPTNNLTCTSTDLEFAWNGAVDPDGDAVNYVIEIAAENSFANILFTAVTAEAKKVFDLKQGITYYWRVKARDDKDNDSAYSEVQSFFTEPEAAVNTLPNTPELISPSLGEIVSGTNITLDWDATDADSDPLTFDLYFGDTNPPVLFVQDVDVSTADVTISTNTTYYWRVVVKDDKQGATIGQMWNFRTK